MEINFEKTVKFQTRRSILHVYSRFMTTSHHFQKLLLSLFVVCLFPFNNSSAILDTKRFDAKPDQRVRYLNYGSTGPLRFSDPQPIADRGNLLVFSTLTPASEPVAPPSPENMEPPVPDFAVVSYEGADNNSSLPDVQPLQFPAIQADVALPLADPFEEMEGEKISTTDDLLEVFESTIIPQASYPVGSSLPFIPPYSVTPDNLKISSKATYRRIER
jgi:hypothetical protein